MTSPFPATPSNPGNGVVHLALLPPSTPVLKTVTYQYPLKLISPAPIAVPDAAPDAAAAGDGGASHLVHTLYLLTYGGGIVAGDGIHLHVTMDTGTRLVLLTQGSTKIFKSPDASVVSKQDLTLDIHPASALCYLPDPVQPFGRSGFKQTQLYNILLRPETTESGSLCVLDWVSEGRRAMGEKWDFWSYNSKNEIWLVDAQAQAQGQAPKKRLLLRDNMLLDTGTEGMGSIAPRMAGLGVMGTLMLYGPRFESLGNFFMDEFKLIPRIGGRKWDTGSDDGDSPVDPRESWRKARRKQEDIDGLLWTAASVRGCFSIKFGAREVEGGKRWLRSMIECEGSVVNMFGERALLCLR